MSSVVVETNDCWRPCEWDASAFIPLKTKIQHPKPDPDPVDKIQQKQRSAYELKRATQFFNRALFACSVLHTVFFVVVVVLITFYS